MNKIWPIAHWRQSPSLVILAIAIFGTLATGISLAIIVLASTILSADLINNPLCFQNDCLKRFIDNTDQAFAIAKATLDIVVAVATAGGIFVALLSYINTSGNAALANHIEHLKVFSEYLESEIKKRDRLSPQLIDTLLLYGKIFSQSRSGKTTVSNEYQSFLVQLNQIIDESNQRCAVGTPGGFSYRDHQRRIRDHLVTAGITVYTAPRNDYFEMEGQLFSLLHRISQSFCSPGILPPIKPQTYH